jgi:hypothetical protein
MHQISHHDLFDFAAVAMETLLVREQQTPERDIASDKVFSRNAY